MDYNGFNLEPCSSANLIEYKKNKIKLYSYPFLKLEWKTWLCLHHCFTVSLIPYSNQRVAFTGGLFGIWNYPLWPQMISSEVTPISPISFSEIPKRVIFQKNPCTNTHLLLHNFTSYTFCRNLVTLSCSSDSIGYYYAAKMRKITRFDDITGEFIHCEVWNQACFYIEARKQ